jgi:hypothetical protein
VIEKLGRKSAFVHEREEDSARSAKVEESLEDSKREAQEE